MTLRDLEYVLALADTGRFSAAAQRCGVTQPTLSMQIAKLEDELGLELFERSHRGAAPTAAGRRIIEQAGVVLDEVHRLRKMAGREPVDLDGPFHLGVIPTIGPYLLPHILPVLQARHPRLELYLREEITDRLLERIRNASIDAAILSLPLDAPLLEIETVYEEDFVVALPTGHRLARRARLSPKDLADENMLVLEEGHCMRDQTLGHCGPPQPGGRYQASSIESLRQMVAAGIGCTLLPALATLGAFGASAPVVVKPFASPVPRREIVLAWRRSLPQRDAVRELARTLRRELRTAMRP